MNPLLCRIAVGMVCLLISQVGPVQAQGLADARSALRTGRYSDAIALFEKAVRGNRSSVPAVRGLVAALRSVGRYSDAADAARHFARVNDGSAELANSLGEILYLTGRLDDAERQFDLASRSATDSLVARYNIAILHYERGRVELAMHEFDRFLEIYNATASLSARELAAVAGSADYLSVTNPQLAKDALRVYDEAIAADPGNLDLRVRQGALFLRRYNGTDARTTFEDVLQVNPQHAGALLGLAETSRFEGGSDVRELTERSLAINPQFTDAHVFSAKLFLETEDYDSAADAIRRALDVNSVSLEARTVEAAILYLRSDDGFADAVAKVLALNPRYAELYATLAEVSARNRLYDAAAEFARHAIALDSLSWRAYGLLGMNQLRSAEMTLGKRNLERAFSGDPYDVWTKNTLDLLDTLERYSVTETARFRFVIDAKESEILSLYVGTLAEEAYDSLAAKYGYEPATPIRVEVYNNHADFSVRTVGLVGLGALGVSFGPVIAMDSPAARSIGDFNWGSTLWHELAHTFHLGMTEHRVPRWFTEGLAVFEERNARDGWGDDVTPEFLIAFQNDKLPPASELNNGFMRPAYPAQLGYSYYEASLVCELIVRDRGFGAIVDILHAYAAGKTTAQTFRQVLDTDLASFDKYFEQYINERFAGPLAALAMARPDDSLAGVARDDIMRRAEKNPNDFVAQLGMGRMLFEQGRPNDAVSYLERAKSLFPQYGGSESPYWYLSQIHLVSGDSAAAARELVDLAEIDGRNYRARMELADLREALHDDEGAARALSELRYIYPFEMPVHERLASLYQRVGDWDSAVAERRAVIALGPVDRAEALYQLARTYYEAGDIANARKAVLRALEGAPNFDDAQDLLLRIHAKRDEGRSDQWR
ncbi:MAG: tetratricopeptide repeat protein [Gemmatimonadales bacterium]